MQTERKRIQITRIRNEREGITANFTEIKGFKGTV